MGIFSGIGSAVGGLFGGVGAPIGGAIGGLIDRNQQRGVNEDNANLQREFAQQGIRWRVADAKAAGLHPLAVLGASGAGASPSYVVGDGGQDISRAVAATRTQDEREAQVRDFMLSKEVASDARVRAALAFETDQRLKQHEIENLSIRNDTAMLDNELTRLQLRRQQGQVGPGMPGVVSSGSVKVKPSEQTSHAAGMESQEAYVGSGKPAFVPYRIGGPNTGFTLDVPSPDFGEGLEGGGPASWALGAAGIGGHYGSKFLDWLNPTGFGAPPPGYVRRYNPRTGKFELLKR